MVKMVCRTKFCFVYCGPDKCDCVIEEDVPVVFEYSEEEKAFINTIVTKLTPIIAEKTGLSEDQAKNAILNEMKGSAFDVLGAWWQRMLPAEDEFPWDELAGIMMKDSE